MDLSVIIVSYNVSSFLDQALTTLEDSARGYEYEVFVVDNASTDDSVEMVRRKHPEVKVIANTDNRGFASANNQALEQAKGKYVLLLNPDTVLSRDTIRVMTGFLDTHHEAGGAGCKVINPDGSLQLACRRGFPSPGVAFFKMVGLSSLFPKSKTFGAYNLTYLDPETTAEVDAISGAFMMLRKEALDRVGFLDETFFMYGEDLDLCFRIKQDGWKIYYIPDTEIIHFKGESTKTVPTIKSIRDFYIAMHIFVEKHYSGSFRLFPQWLLILGIYLRMGWVYGLRTIISLKAPLIDLLLLNLSLALGVLVRFGVSEGNYPPYSKAQWVIIFLVYSSLYLGRSPFSACTNGIAMFPNGRSWEFFWDSFSMSWWYISSSSIIFPVSPHFTAGASIHSSSPAGGSVWTPSGPAMLRSNGNARSSLAISPMRWC